MECTAEFHDQIADARLPQAEPIFDNATALDATVDMLDPQPAVVEPLIRPLLLHPQLLATWSLCWHEDLHVGEREGQKAESL
jgi:hypothetical protein